MTDLIERLRWIATDINGNYVLPIATDAADALEAQAKEVAALRADLQEAVKWIPNGILHSANPRLSAIYNRLNAALKEEP